MKLKRNTTQYANCLPKAIAEGSRAQMMYFVEDAKHDIEALTAELAELRQKLELAHAAEAFEANRGNEWEARATAAEQRLEAAERLVTLLRDDLIRACEGDYELCEGCGAPIFVEDEIATVEEVKGCWGYVADVKNTPCWRYRTQRGVERSWPVCAALANQGEGNG